MKTTDFRNATFAGLRRDMNESLEAVYKAWVKHGPGTTRQIATLSEIDILTLRPRTTDLTKTGLVVLAADKDQQAGHEGVYRARTQEEWDTWFAGIHADLVSGQQQLI